MKIPKKIQILGRTIEVVIGGEDPDGDGAWGEAVFKEGRIYLYKKSKGEKVSRDAMEATFFHELTHWILNMQGYDKENNDEDFVDRVSGAMHQIFNQLIAFNRVRDSKTRTR